MSTRRRARGERAWRTLVVNATVVGDMITLYGLSGIFEGGVGETKDLWVQWALEESGLPYRVHALDQRAGDLDKESYARISPFRQIPVIEDDGFVIAESGAILLYIAERAGKLIPADVQGRTRVTQWCFAALSTVAPTLGALDLIDIFDKGAHALRADVRKIAERWLSGVERRLSGRQWIATDEFTVADVLMAGVLREIRKTDMLEPYPNMKAYYARAFGRPAWEKTLRAYADRFGVTVDEIR